MHHATLPRYTTLHHATLHYVTDAKAADIRECVEAKGERCAVKKAVVAVVGHMAGQSLGAVLDLTYG